MARIRLTFTRFGRVPEVKGKRTSLSSFAEEPRAGQKTVIVTCTGAGSLHSTLRNLSETAR